VAARSEGYAAKEAVFPATLADSASVWPRLIIEIAKGPDRPRAVRKRAIFWAAEAAADSAVQGLREVVDDEAGEREVRESAIFALSQLKDDQGVPALIDLVRTSPDSGVRHRAIFWLGQSDGPRAVALFEAIVLDRN
jgi:HEAT repeat protein